MINGVARSEDIAAWFACYQFLAFEAECLDDNRVTDWLGLLTPDITYDMPIMQTQRRTGDPIAPNGWHMKETFGSLESRVARLGTNSAWGEDPPSRTRRLIGNVRGGPWGGAEFDVRSNLLLYLGRGDSVDSAVLGAERRDVLRCTADGLRLARRTVLLSHTTLPVQSLGVFL
ncbi:MAG: aromatic-ring-hydroxylating dioxygenase subunit beta [Alphaproteobacteria bacterium]|nr:aromatic-ring-hydroxylating dioxygenase subunit beta [Alphaproteobacteria bacterium]